MPKLSFQSPKEREIALELEREVMRETGFRAKLEPISFTYIHESLIDGLREKLRANGIKFEEEGSLPGPRKLSWIERWWRLKQFLTGLEK